jgi:formate dehydrogenase iron-sulfur subunit
MSNAVLYDAGKCIGCRACQVACKQWNELSAEITRNNGSYENPPRLSASTFTKIRFKEVESSGTFHFVFSKVQCMHCEHPACASACPVGALKKMETGPVVYDDSICFGCRYCMVACPFGIPNFQWDEPLPWIRKCSFCADRQSVGLRPACVTACPTGALVFGERDKLIQEARERITAAPSAYINHIYGEHEIGGTSWLYLSPVAFEELGFPALPSEPVSLNVERAMSGVPPALITVAAVMTGIYWVMKRRNKNQQAEVSTDKKEKVTK